MQHFPGWAVESPETGGEVQGATGQERPQLSDEGSMINTGTHMEEKVLAKHANMQVNKACYNLDYSVRLGLQWFHVAHCSLSSLFMQLQRTFYHTTGHHSPQHRGRGKLPAPLVQFHPGALRAADEERQDQEVVKTPVIQDSQVWWPFPTRKKS